jgi:DNA processing protein
VDLIIARIPGLKGADAKKLCARFDREEGLTGLEKKDMEQFLGHFLPPSFSWDTILTHVEQDEKKAALLGIKMASLGADGYPPLVREIFDPPPVLFYRGCLPNPEKSLVAVVGTRRPSSRAAAQAVKLGRELALAGIPVVSGLALGIDALAHRGNVEGGGPTLAVLGSGPDEVYPASNRPLARRILDAGGCLIGEYPPGTKPMKWYFPARNRIISALSRGVVIVEAPERSGALITAALALEQNRDLWVASVGVSSPVGKGTAKLAEEGARVISSGAEIAEEWGI